MLVSRLRGDPPAVKPPKATKSPKDLAKLARAAERAAAKAAALASRATKEPKEPKEPKEHGGKAAALVMPAASTGFARDGWLELRKEFAACLQAGDLFLFRAAVLPSGHHVSQQQQRQRPPHAPRPVKHGMEQYGAKHGAKHEAKHGAKHGAEHVMEGAARPEAGLGTTEAADPVRTTSEWHIPPGTPLPLPPLRAVLAAFRGSSSRCGATGDGVAGAATGDKGVDVASGDEVADAALSDEVAGEAASWGPWRVTAAAKRSGPLGGSGCSSKGGKGGKGGESGEGCFAGGFVRLARGVVPSDWLGAATYTKQAVLLPLRALPQLAAPALGELQAPLPSSASSASSLGAEPVADLRCLLRGSFSYSVLLPLPCDAAAALRYGHGDGGGVGGGNSGGDGGGGRELAWDWSLQASPDARLLALRGLDRTLRRIVPVVAPVPTSAEPATEPLYCLVEVRYEYRPRKVEGHAEARAEGHGDERP